MKVLIGLTYYSPHTSGLTVYAQRLATGLAARGHQVTVLTSWFDRTTPREEKVDGVRIVRVPVLFRVSKGVIMPSFGRVATRLVREHDVVSLHLPQFDAAGVALRGRLFGRPTTLTYHCDLILPGGRWNRVVNGVVDRANALAGLAAHGVIAYTRDFAEHSSFLRRFARKLEVIPPPVDVPAIDPENVRAFRDRFGVDDHRPTVGMAARLASEKGVEVLLRALPKILEEVPGLRVLFAGQHEQVLGEAEYARRLAPMLERHRDRWAFLGVLDAEEMAAFFRTIDVITVPSLNSTESFGLVQVEAMMCGTPSIASDLPGVRQPVRVSGMGEIVPVGDSEALAAAIVRVIRERSRYIRPREEIRNLFSVERTAQGYESLFQRLLAEIR